MCIRDSPSSGVMHNFCTRAHARQAASLQQDDSVRGLVFGECGLQGCSTPVQSSPSGQVYNYCCRQHALQAAAGSNRGAAPAAVAQPRLQGVARSRLASVSDLPDDGRECSICLCDFEAGDRVSRLLCMHLLHTECADSWFQTKPCCPLCQTALKPSK
eukprot:TRINITY_DN13529_c0_g1_i3.p1 TRINITY_DN13529_c0_g1~~TRINITY_DN13529_c0_g1_i3.p1  ORF type:complete len:158 (+),score=32.68 TRINITY_DN13529_c0_g1_i3:114-587(+)